MTKRRIFLRSATILFCVFMLLCAVVFPAEAAESIMSSLSLAVRRVVPSLFVFSALAALFARIGLFTRAGRLGRLFGLSPACTAVALCGLLCGFPTSAVCAHALWESGEADAGEMRAVLPFCSNAGMAFVVGAVGGGMLGSRRAGYMLFLMQTVLSIVFILLFCRSKSAAAMLPVRAKKESLSHALVASVSAAGGAMLAVCAFIAFFGAAADMICLVFPSVPPLLRAVICSFFEISRGCAEFSGAAELSPLLRYVGVAFALGFSGVSVACQISERAGEISLSVLPYLAKKLIFGLAMAASGGIFAIFVL
ncbi:MAG: hypothetical protein KH352_04450 [Ruminococcus sp.]|nr:hypothetical protein [Candidatus Apopatosoma intestinale]